MLEESLDTPRQSIEKQYETQLLLFLSLLFIVLFICCFALSELTFVSPSGAGGQQGAIRPLPLALCASSLGGALGFLACYALTNRFTSAGKLSALFPLALCGGAVGLFLDLADLPGATLLVGFGSVFPFVQWLWLSRPVSSHSFLVITLATATAISGAFLCFLGASSAFAQQVLVVLALCFFLSCCFVNFILYLRTRPEIGELPGKQASAFRSHIVSTTFRPAVTDGFVLGLCLRGFYEGATQGSPVGISVGVAIVLSACFSCLQVIPRSNYERFVRNHANTFKIIPFLLPVLFSSEHILVTGGISLLIVMVYVSFLVTSLNERILILDLSPFYTYGTHGTIFFLCMIVGIAICPAFLLIHIEAPIWCTLVFLASLVAMEWLLVGTYGRKSYLDPESNQISTWEKMTQGESDVHSGHSDGGDREGLSVNRAAGELSGTIGDEARVSRFSDGQSGSEGRSAADGADSEDSTSRWSNHIRRTAEMYGLSARQEEVLFLLAKGRTAQFIADKLVITPATAKSHIYNIYIKFSVHSQQELLNLLESESSKQEASR